MNRFRKAAIWGVSLVIMSGFLAAAINADDHGKRHRRGERRHSENSHHGDRNLTPIRNSAYVDRCGSCHFAYQPELLPAESWRKILDGTEDHFGETLDLDLDPSERAEIAGYLASNAADMSPAKLPRKIMRSLNGATPLRITEIPCIRKEHHEVSSQVLKRRSVGSLSNCIACHRTADKGVYDDDDVFIPEQ